MLHPLKFGLAGGLVCGVLMFLLTLLSIFTGYGHHMLSIIKDMNPGYSISFAGSIIGFIYGFIKSFIILYVFAWVYNYLPVK